VVITTKMGICQLCGEEKKLQEHHIDYENKIILNICSSCHTKIHSIKRVLNIKLTKPTKIKCDKCNYSWIYKGANPNFVTCPNCQRKTEIKNELVK